jgi:hydrogenase/urease accessory protein HupE
MALPADAHLVSTGLGSVADGAARLVLTPSDLLLVCGLSVLAVQQGAAPGVSLRWFLPLAWLVGGLAGLRLPEELITPWAQTLAFTSVGLLVALQVRMPQVLIQVLGVAAGLWFGLVNGSALAHHTGAVPALAGGVVGVAVLTAVLTQRLAPPHPTWQRIGLRVAGSWMAAAGLLMVGWLIRSST